MRRALIGAVACVALAVGLASPASATAPAGGSPAAGLYGSVEDACSHQPISGAQIWLRAPSGATIPVAPTRHGAFRVSSLAGPGTYHLSATAPGYLALTSGHNDPVDLVLPPDPSGLGAGVAATQGLHVAIALQPLSTRRNCSSGFSLSVLALTGSVRDASSGNLVHDLRCSIRNPGGNTLRSARCFTLLGHLFVSALPPGTWTLALLRPGHPEVTIPIVNPQPPHASKGRVAAGLVLGIEVPGTLPPPILPEAPMAALLAIPAVGAVGLFVVRHRRRSAALAH